MKSQFTTYNNYFPKATIRHGSNWVEKGKGLCDTPSNHTVMIGKGQIIVRK